MNGNKEMRLYQEQFAPEVFEILGVTGPNGFSGGKGGKETLWQASLNLLAWRRADEQEIVMEEKLLTAKVDDEGLSSLRRAAGANQVIRVSVRQNERCFLIAGPMEQASDPALEEILAEQTKEITLEDPELGLFTLNRQVDWFEKEIRWGDKSVRISLENEDREGIEEQLRTIRELVKEQQAWDLRLRKFAAAELLMLKNDTWLEEEEEEVSEEQFIQRMELQDITIGPEGGFVFWFGDDDMFWGHSITVSGTVMDGLDSANIEG